MAKRVAEQFSFGGVDSRSNPTNFPSNRSLRLINFSPQKNGALRLRFGHTQPSMSTVTASAIHSAIYYELWNGTQYVLFGQGTDIKRMAVSGGAVTTLGTLSNSNPWAFFRANNQIHFSNGTDFKFYDGTTLRNSGIRAPNSTESGGVSVAESTATAGSFDTTTLTGYQAYMSFYNPTTQHVGNRVKVGARVQITGSGRSLVFSGLPNLSGVDTEFVKLLGRTPDGGEVPYAFVDANGNFIVAGNTATSATVTLPDVDFNSELPTRNGVPPGMTRLVRVMSRMFGVSSAAPNIVRYSEAEEDVVSGDFLGRPEQSWPANNAEAFPTGEAVSCLGEFANEGFFASKPNLAIWSEAVRQIGGNFWAGPWPIGCAGSRAFKQTPRGPFWLSQEKQLMTMSGDGPIPISDEYERALLSKISDANLPNAELGYLRDAKNGIDRLYVFGKDASSNPVVIVHDFELRDDQSPFGQGYEYSYSGLTISTLVEVKDASGKPRLWAGSTAGRFHQLEDGTNDNSSTYAGDYIGLLALGEEEPLVVAVQYQGDSQLQFAYGEGLDFLLADLVARSARVVDAGNFKNEFQVGRGLNQMFYRFQLTSHDADGDFELGDPPHLPVNSYGAILNAKLKLGRPRPEGR